MIKNSFTPYILPIVVAVLLHVGSGSASAAVLINQRALDAVQMQETIIYQLQRYVEFLRFSLAYISPTPETGMSMVKGSESQSRYARMFRNLEHNRKRQSNQNELWRDLLETGESQGIQKIMFTIEPFGKELFGEDYPRMEIPFYKGGRRFSFGIRSLRYIIPAHSGVIIGDPDEFEKSMIDYLQSSLMFYPVVTVEIPISSEVRNNYFYEQIQASILRKVPEAYFEGDNVCLTIFPTIDKVQTIIRNTRESMFQGLGID